MNRRRCQACPNRGRGQALAEFAIVFPMFALLFFGFIDIGRYVFVANSLNQAAREGARYGAVIQWDPDCPATVSPKSRFTCTQQVTLDRMAGVPGNVTALVTCDELVPGGVAPETAAGCGPTDLLTVKTEIIDFRFITPLIGNLIGPRTITGQAQVVVQ